MPGKQKKNKIKLSPAGNCAGGILESLKRLKELGLDGQEIEFTYGVKMSNALAKQAGELAKKLGLKLSVHAPYYVNLCSEEKAKIEASKKRILMSCERAHYLGASPVVFHAGFYGKRDAEETYQCIKQGMVDLQQKIKKKNWKVKLAPETTGKKSQFGSVDELLRLKKEIGTDICIDFAHLKARNNGKIDYGELFKKLKHVKHLHCHFSGIEFTAKGERRHLVMKDSEINELLKALLKYNVDCMIISESPVTYQDSLKMKRILEKL
jgi:deoxyribonuclease-4